MMEKLQIKLYEYNEAFVPLLAYVIYIETQWSSCEIFLDNVEIKKQTKTTETKNGSFESHEFNSRYRYDKSVSNKGH